MSGVGFKDGISPWVSGTLDQYANSFSISICNLLLFTPALPVHQHLVLRGRVGLNIGTSLCHV